MLDATRAMRRRKPRDARPPFSNSAACVHTSNNNPKYGHNKAQASKHSCRLGQYERPCPCMCHR